MNGAPSARGARLHWADLPERVVAAIEDLLGGSVVAADTQPHGFSPGVAARVALEDGGRAFVKVVGPEPNPTSPEFHRREARIVRTLPASAPVPSFLGDVEVDGWVALAFEAVDGAHPSEPWREDELARVIEAAHDLVAAVTPAPADVPSGRDALAELNCWHRARAEAPPGLDEWSSRHIDELVELERGVEALDGDTLVHFDLRADNILLGDGRVWFVDWPHAVVGPAWIDAVGFAPSVAMQGGPPPGALLPRWPAAGDASPDAVDAVIASVAGFFTYGALLPPPPGLPTLRAFQAAQGEVARAWLAERRGWR